MGRKHWLFAASGLAAAMCSPVLAMAQTADTQADRDADSPTAKTGDVVVIVHGVRASVEDANKKKRKAKQITDSVSAEDAGKLPDNNVPEALAHITGVQITREHGEGATSLSAACRPSARRSTAMRPPAANCVR